MSTSTYPGYRSPVHNDVCAGLLECAGRGMLRQSFLSESARLIRDWCDCDTAEIRLVERDKLWCARASAGPETPGFEVLPGRRNGSGCLLPCRSADGDFEELCEQIAERRSDLSLPWFTLRGTFWTGDVTHVFPPDRAPDRGGRSALAEDCRSLVITPFSLDDRNSGLIILRSERRNFFRPDQIGSHEHVAQILGVAVRQRRAQRALRERVKELTCLHGIARIAARPGVGLDDILQRAAELIPTGCLHEKLARARIAFDGRVYHGGEWEAPFHVHDQDIVMHGSTRGRITLAYTAVLPELDVGPFIREELNMLEAIANELALVIEAHEVDEKRAALEEQLRHADRLATIGQLAAGVAHELNEPLVTILGRAQLVRKDPDASEQVNSDCDKIISASLHARDVISKLRLFARRTPAQKERTDLNEVVSDGLVLLQDHVERSGITLETEYESTPPFVMADRGQLYQVLVNLVVNALQATPSGGRIIVRTVREACGVSLIVKDTGKGMSETTLRQIFTPFFTTKEVDEGTGLGLSVVQGIVSTHGGTVGVTSTVGKGSRFHVWLPRALDGEPPDPNGEEVADG